MTTAAAFSSAAPQSGVARKTAGDVSPDRYYAKHDPNAVYDIDESPRGAAKPRKKRRVVRTPDKKYQCPADDCGKSYSRAEHLYRHQLNHTPKQIYRCDFPGCDRHFVRADLCARHRERHTAKGSHLQRKDAFMHNQRAAAAAATTNSTFREEHRSTSPDHADSDRSPSRTHLSHSAHSTSESYTPEAQGTRFPNTGLQDHFHSAAMPSTSSVAAEPGLPHDTRVESGGPAPYNAYPEHTGARPVPGPTSHGTRYSYDAVYDSTPDGVRRMPELAMNTTNDSSMGASTQPHSNYIVQQQLQFATAPTLSGSETVTYPNIHSVSGYGMNPAYGHNPGSGMSVRDSYAIQADALSAHPYESQGLETANLGYTMPVFGGDGFSRSPSAMMDDSFLNMLFTANGNFEPLGLSPPIVEPPVEPVRSYAPNGGESERATGLEADEKVSTLDALDINLRESIITERKQQRLLALVGSWGPTDHSTDTPSRDEILAGDISNPTHVMSLQMIKTYIASFWTNIHCQMPILHRPTFNPETCPDLLVLAMACLGATCLERIHTSEQTRLCAELAFFMAHHIRWDVFEEAEFRPPAKLWTFQTMLLLELFEKMYSTRALHERAHIHHATTLTVMRRGSSLIGRSASDVHQKSNDPTRTPPGPDGSINTSGQNTPDAFWNRWITAEATRRVAFAAFIIDSTHATLFGHAAAMSPHDLRLALPCDEALWSATSSAEVQRVEASLAANGFKPATFLDGLKRTLNGQKVRTNTFGRVVLMSGLLNISWHMNQRDLQVSSLGAATTLGNQIRWRSPLTRAFDFWRRDFDESLSKSESWLQVCNHRSTNDQDGIGHRDHVFESRTCLHSLAHMAMHVDIADCLVFAGSDHVLSRAVTDVDRAAVQRRMRQQWAPSARARDATFFALRFLSEVLIPEEELTASRATDQRTPIFRYSARDDYLLNRPWVLYFALLIVWSYGFALDGSLNPSAHVLNTRDQQIRDMQSYLIRMGGVASPDDLEQLTDRNACLGLLLLLQESFGQPRWELLQDAHAVLGSCIDLLLSKPRNENSRTHLNGI